MTAVEPIGVVSVQVEIDGRPIAGEVWDAITSVEVEDELNLPDVAEIVVRDEEHSVLDGKTFEIGSPIVISVSSEQGTAERIFDGEITGYSVEIGTFGTVLVVRGHDKSHRLQRETRVATSLDKKSSDVVNDIAGAAGLSADVDATSVVHPALVDWNRTGWELISQLADDIGYEVNGSSGKLTFKKPVEASAAAVVELSGHRDFADLRISANSAQQVEAVTVRGWDPVKKEPVESTAKVRQHAKGVATNVDIGKLASEFDAKAIIEASGVTSSVEQAKLRAEALAAKVGAAAVEMEGTVSPGVPKLRAGAVVSVTEVGRKFTGKYVLSSVRHRVTPEGYTSSIRAGGPNRRDLLGLAGSGGGDDGRATVHGVVVGLVTDVEDPDGTGRVKVEFPWLEKDKAVTWWARVAMPGAGKDRGLILQPEVGDEVLVAFDHGDVRQPYVLGGLHNGKDKVEKMTEIRDKKDVKRRVWRSREGHEIRMDDDEAAITVVSSDEKHQVVIDEKNSKVAVTTAGEVTVEADGNVGVTTKADLTLEAKGKVTIKAQGVSVDAGGGAFEAKGMGAKVDAGGGNFEANGTQATVSGTAKAELSSSGQTAVKGSIVQIN